MKKVLLYTISVVIGVAAGIIFMGLLSVRASQMYLEVFRSNIIAEQMRLAAQAHEKGDKYSELVHRSNIVTFSQIGDLDPMENMKGTWSFSFPFTSLVLERIGAGSDKGEKLNKGKRIAYAIDLGRLAEAMENLGLNSEAIPLWKESAKLMGHNDVEKVRSFVSGLHKIESESFSQKNKN
ncbi:MAG: hypothetical protein ACXU9L_05525 [Thermodesulfobacteriota bacterium]